MFDSIFEFVARILDLIYGVFPNYAISIIVLTLVVMMVTTPLTLRGTRGMIKMQLLAPELKKIQDRQKSGKTTREEMNAEMMAFYQENGMNPLGGCLPMLAQMPVFMVMFQLIQGLTRTGSDGFFNPKFLSESSGLYEALHGSKKMMAFGIDFAESTRDSLGDSIIHGLPHLLLILAMIGAQYVAQKQISARSNGAAAMPQQQMLLKVMPAFFGVMSISFPSALVLYWTTSSVFRIGLQWYITKSLYSGEDSLGAQASAVSAQLREEKAKNGKASGPASPAAGPKVPKSSTPPVETGGSSPQRAGATSRPHPSSKKKRKRK